MKPAQIRFPDWRSHLRCETSLWPNFLSFGISLPSLTGSCIHKMKVSTCADHLITMIQELIMVGAFCTWDISFKHLPLVLSFCHDYRLCLLQRNYLFSMERKIYLCHSQKYSYNLQFQNWTQQHFGVIWLVLINNLNHTQNRVRCAHIF